MVARYSRGVRIIDQPLVQTVILNYRTPDLTLRAAEAALREMEGIPGEITIVDNDSGDGSYAFLRDTVARRGWAAFGRVRVLNAGWNGGFGAGNNVAIRAGLISGIRPDFVYVLNSDAFPDAGAVRALVAHLDAHPSVGLAGSYIHGPDGAPHVTAFRFPSIPSEFEGAACTGAISRLLARHIVSLPLPDKTRRVDWLAGASVMMRCSMLDQIGLFDEGFFLYFEETDLCRRAARAGWATSYVRESSVTHIGSASTGMKTWRRTPRYWFDSRMRYFVKTHGAIYAALATAAHVAGALVYRVRRLLTNKRRIDPPRFLRDLVRHAFRTAFARPKPAGEPAARPMLPSPAPVLKGVSDASEN